jgi:NTE family protein
VKRKNTPELTAMVLQGGGALGAYQGGVYETLAANNYQPDWVAGISIGAINAAVIAGNPVENRVKKLRAFWEGVSAGLRGSPLWSGPEWRRLHGEVASAASIIGGSPGFFKPRFPPPFLMFGQLSKALSYYDTAPLAKTLNDLVDFDFLNERGPRLSVGATNIESGNFEYFDSDTTTIGPEHIMASGALPPGFPPVVISGQAYWDGGLVSNTPLQYVLENAESCTLTIFQIDLFSAYGQMPSDLSEVAQRQKDIQFSSRTRLTTDRFRQLGDISAAAKRLSKKLPAALRDDVDMAFLRNICPADRVTLIHLIHRKENFEGSSKDYEFSRLSMEEHWAAGIGDVTSTLQHQEWQTGRTSPGIRVFDFGGKARIGPDKTAGDHRCSLAT